MRPVCLVNKHYHYCKQRKPEWLWEWYGNSLPCSPGFPTVQFRIAYACSATWSTHIVSNHAKTGWWKGSRSVAKEGFVFWYLKLCTFENNLLPHSAWQIFSSDSLLHFVWHNMASTFAIRFLCSGGTISYSKKSIMNINLSAAISHYSHFGFCTTAEITSNVCTSNTHTTNTYWT